jgi:hypothetical protein
MMIYESETPGTEQIQKAHHAIKFMKTIYSIIFLVFDASRLYCKNIDAILLKEFRQQHYPAIKGTNDRMKLLIHPLK